MKEDRYLFYMPKGKWVISREVGGRWISLHQDNPLFEQGDDVKILQALRISATKENLDEYFPRNADGNRCPTLDLMEHCNVLDPTNPHIKKKKMVGV